MNETNSDNAEQLKKISSLFNTSKIITNDDIESILKGLVTILANNKKSVDSTSEEVKQKADELFQKVMEAQDELREQVDTHTASTKDEISKTVEDRIQKAISEVQDLLGQVKETASRIPLDGKDADEEAVVAEVLKQIKLPEQKEIILDGPDEIRDKITSLKGEKRLDVKALKGLDGLRDQIVNHATTQARGLLYAGLLENSSTGGGSGTVGPGTANEIAYFDSTTTVNSLTTATYPSLTELSYVKGVTSAIQTQLDAKGTFTLPALTAGSVLFSNGTTIAQNNTAFNWNDTNTALALTGSSNNTTLNITNTSVTSQAIFSVTGPASTDVNTGKGFTVFTTGEAFARAMFYTDGKFGIGPGSGARDVYLSRSTTSVFRVSSDGATGAADIEITRNVLPVTSGTGTLGSTTKQWANEFLASGAVINWNNGNATLTHSAGLITSNVSLSLGTSNVLTTGTIELGAASDTTISRVSAGVIAVEGVNVLLNGGALGTPSSGTLTNCTGLPVAGITASTSTALGVGSLELGHATDTTLSRSSAGVLAVEGVVIPSISSTNTLTNKRVTKRTGTTTSSATPTINTNNVDFYSLTAQAADITSFTTNLSGTPTEGQTLWIAITGTAARAITWGTSFEASTVALPTTTVTTNRLDVGFVWNTVTSKWRCIATC